MSVSHEIFRMSKECYRRHIGFDSLVAEVLKEKGETAPHPESLIEFIWDLTYSKRMDIYERQKALADG